MRSQRYTLYLVAIAFWTLVGLFLLAGCSNTPAQQQQHLSALCAHDPAAYAAVQAVTAVVPVPGVAVAGSVDALLVHPAIVAACAKYGAVPVKIVTEPVATSAAAP